MKKALLLPAFACAGLFGVASPRDCITTPVKQHVRATNYLVVGAVTANLDATTTEGRNYRGFLRLMHRDSLKYCVTAKFKISNRLKGTLSPTQVIEVVSPQGEAPVFKLGGRYVLFLRREGERFFVSSCSYSSELNNDPASAKLMQAISAALRSLPGVQTRKLR